MANKVNWVSQIIRILIGLIATFFCALPVELWFAIYKYASPEGFWQRFALVGGGIFVFGGVQVILFIVWCFAMFALVFEWD